MTKLLALTSAAALALAPAIASAESPLYLNSTKSSGNPEPVVLEDEIIFTDEGGIGLGGIVVLGLGALALAAVVASSDDDDVASTGATGGTDN